MECKVFSEHPVHKDFGVGLFVKLFLKKDTDFGGFSVQNFGHGYGIQRNADSFKPKQDSSGNGILFFL